MSTQTYDALGFDPAPGIPASVQRVVTALSRVGNQLSEAHKTLSKVGRQDGIWEGEAASRFAKKVGELPKYLADGHGSLIDAAHAMSGRHTKLTELQSLAGQYESEAREARRQVKEAEADPDLKLAGRTFDTGEALAAAQQRLDGASRRLDSATESLNHIIKKAQDLLDEHGRAAREVIEAIRRAAERAPDEPGLFDRFMDALKGVSDKVKELADDLGEWVKDHADDIYKIGDWLNVAAAACDVLAIIFSETGIGAVVFEAVGRALNAGALAAHTAGYAAGAKKGSWWDIGFDVAGFVPFGDLIKGGKVAVGAFKGVEISGKYFKAAERVGDIAAKAPTGRLLPDASKKLLGVFGKKQTVYRATADTFKDRFAMAADRVFNDSTRYDRPFMSPAKWLDSHVLPKVIDNTPLSNIPSLADSVQIGKGGKRFIDPTSWVSRGVETAWRVHKFAGATENALSNEVHGKYDKVKGMMHGAFG